MAKERTTDPEEQARGRSGEERRPARREAGSHPALPGGTSSGNPFTLVRRFMDDLDRLFEGFGPGLLPRIEVPGGPEGRESTWFPAVEVFDRGGQLVVRADVPGVSKDQIRVEIEEGQLIISGERVREHEERRSGMYRSERTYGAFHRAIPLPEGVSPEQAKATFTNGVLEVVMPLPQQARSRRLEVQEGPQGGQQAAKSA